MFTKPHTKTFTKTFTFPVTNPAYTPAKTDHTQKGVYQSKHFLNPMSCVQYSENLTKKTEVFERVVLLGKKAFDLKALILDTVGDTYTKAFIYEAITSLPSRPKSPYGASYDRYENDVYTAYVYYLTYFSGKMPILVMERPFKPFERIKGVIDCPTLGSRAFLRSKIPQSLWDGLFFNRLTQTQAGNYELLFSHKKIEYKVTGLGANHTDLVHQLETTLSAIKAQRLAKKKARKVVVSDQETRNGKDYRQGQNVALDTLLGTFGLKAVRFGGWVTAKERQDFLNKCYDGLMDLAGVLNKDPKFMGLGGNLTISFGADCGGDGFSRHPALYYYQEKTIALAKTEGKGALCHEWFHAYDHHLTDRQVSSFATMHHQAFFEMMNANGFANFIKRNGELDVEYYPNKPYYKTPRELSARLFECIVRTKLDQNNQHSLFLLDYPEYDQNSNNPYLNDTAYCYLFRQEREWAEKQGMFDRFLGFFGL